jgi:hypothetical protein
MPSASCVGPVKSQAKFNRHVKPGDSLRQLDTGQIVNRRIGFFNQPDDRFEPILVRNSQGWR